jgi:hypothetical protein
MMQLSTVRRVHLVLFVSLLWVAADVRLLLADDAVHLRANQVGYRSADSKVAIAFSNKPVEGRFSLLEVSSDKVVFSGDIAPSPAPGWGGLLSITIDSTSASFLLPDVIA